MERSTIMDLTGGLTEQFLKEHIRKREKKKKKKSLVSSLISLKGMERKKVQER